MLYRRLPTPFDARACLAWALLGATTLATPALAQTRLKPGLWEHSMQMSSQSGQLEAAMKQAQAAMASMPPEQRKMMEQMMAKQGVGLDASGHKLRLCLTPEDVARDTVPAAQDGCTQTSQRSGNTWQVSFQCPARDGQPASSGSGSVTLQNPGAYTGQFKMQMQVDRKPEQMTLATQGRWLSADCGSVRPAGR